MANEDIDNKEIIIYDGYCGFCNKTVMFVAKKDKNNRFRFVSSLSNLGESLLSKHNIKGLEVSTIILLDLQKKITIKSTAIRKIVLKIPLYCIVGILMYLSPKFLSNWMYDFISKNRKKILKNDICEIPNSKIRKKFIM